MRGCNRAYASTFALARTLVHAKNSAVVTAPTLPQVYMDDVGCAVVTAPTLPQVYMDDVG
jgi:hypothetical protein